MKNALPTGRGPTAVKKPAVAAGTVGVAEAPYTPEQAQYVRDQYSTALTYIVMKDPHLKRNGKPFEKPAHQFYLSYASSLRYRETSETALARVVYSPYSPIGEIHFNPRNCKNLGLGQFCGLTVHELGHIICGHVNLDREFRRKYPKIVAIASDIVVNQITEDDGYTIPYGAGILEDEPEFVMEGATLDSTCRSLQVPNPGKDQSTEFYCLWLLEVLKQAEQQKGSQKPCPDCGGSGKGEPGGEGQGEEPDDCSGDEGDESSEDADGDQPGDQGQGPGEAGASGKPGGKSGHGGGTEPCDCETCKGKGKLGGKEWAEAVIDALAGSTNHDGSMLDGESEEELSQEQEEIVRRYIAENIKEAVATAGGIGSLPGSIQNQVQNLLKCLEPKCSLEHVVSEFYGGCGTAVSYSRRHRMRRTSPLPGLIGQKPGMSAGAVIDSSGSNSDQEFAYAFGILKKLANAQDMEVFVQQSSYGPCEEIIPLSEAVIGDNVNRVGYGGTNMRPGIMGFLAQTEEGDEYAVGGILVCTDSELGMDSLVTPEEAGDVPIVWLNSRRNNPFKGHRFAGRMFYYESESGLVEELF